MEHRELSPTKTFARSGRILPLLLLLASGRALGAASLPLDTKNLVFENAENRVLLGDVPYFIMKGRLDCGFTAGAMLLGKLTGKTDNTFYPRVIYNAASAYGFSYLESSLWPKPAGILPGSWLASLYGLRYEQTVPGGQKSDKAWDDYLTRVWGYLKKGTPVYTCRGWPGARETGGKIFTSLAFRPFWWEGIDVEHRANNHFLVIVGLDKEKGHVFVNDPAWGWLGMGKYERIPLEDFRQLIEQLGPGFRYWTSAFLPGQTAAPDETRIQRGTRQRIDDRLRGIPEAYLEDSPGTLYGCKALAALRKDLEPDNFKRILRNKEEFHGMSPYESVTYMGLWLGQYSFLAQLTIEHMEATGRAAELVWLSELDVLYRKLSVHNSRLRALFSKDRSKALAACPPILTEMREVTLQIERHLENYPR